MDPFVIRAWDGSWYLRAAQYGWPHHLSIGIGPPAQNTLAFFPALPVLIRAAHTTGIGWGLSGTLATMATEVAMVICFWLLARDLWGAAVADRATVLLCFFPAAFIFSLIYTEPLLIAASCACILALRRRQWVLAGMAAALGTATHPNGIALIACCAWEVFFAVHSRREWRSLAAIVLAPTGIVCWFAYLWATTGAKLAWYHTERNGWLERESVLAPLRLIQNFAADGFGHPNRYVPLIATAVTVVLVVLLVRAKVPGVLLVFTAIVIGMSLLSTTRGLRLPFVLTAFPLILALGYWLRGQVYSVVVAVSAMLMSALLIVTLATTALTP